MREAQLSRRESPLFPQSAIALISQKCDRTSVNHKFLSGVQSGE